MRIINILELPFLIKGDSMDENEEEEFFRMIGLTGTKRILSYLDGHGKAQYKEFAEFLNIHTLNVRLQQLLRFNLIEHHLTRKDVRKEWYTITEKGRKILKHVEDMLKLIEL